MSRRTQGRERSELKCPSDQASLLVFSLGLDKQSDQAATRRANNDDDDDDGDGDDSLR